MKILITGGCGFLGSNLAYSGNKRGHKIVVFDNLSRIGAYENLKWLKDTKSNIEFIHGDIRNKGDVEKLIKYGEFDVVFHLAGQVAMTTSIENPYKDFEINTIGTLNILDSIRQYSPETSVFYSSTNKVYGDLEQFTYIEREKRYICEEYPEGFDEKIALDFHSPYGCSKGSADQYMLDFARMFGIKTVVFRHSSMYGGRQFATYDQGWIGWFCQKALEQKNNLHIEPYTISGSGKQVRDILHIDDMIELYYTSLEKVDNIWGNAFNIGGGTKHSLSLLELFDLLNDMLGIQLTYTQIAARASDQKIFVADTTKIYTMTDWKPSVGVYDGIQSMLEWIKKGIN